MEQLRKIHKVSENLTLFGNVANAIDDNFEHLKEKLENTEAQIPKDVNLISGIEQYATKAFVLNVVATVNSGGAVSLSEYATKRYVDDKTLTLSTLIYQNSEEINLLKSSEKPFTTQLPDDTHVVFPVGNIDLNITVADLKNMTLSQIIERMLFKETWPDSENDYSYYCDIKVPSIIVRYDSEPLQFSGSIIEPDQKKTDAVSESGFVKYKTNASEVTTSLTSTSKTDDWDIYEYTVGCVFESKTVVSTSNFGNTRNYNYDTIGFKSYSSTVSRVYPTYISTEEILISNNTTIERTLQSKTSEIFIAVPYKGNKQPVVKIQLNTLGWLDANTETWEESIIENYNNTGHTYKKLKYCGVIENTPFRFNIKWQ